MLSIIQAAGWPIWTLIVASVVALTLIIERFMVLRAARVAPAGLVHTVLEEYQKHGLSREMLEQLAESSPLGGVLAVGLRNLSSSREVMKESIEEAGRLAAHRLERYLSALGTIAAMSPLLGLLGTVIGMIEIFGSQGPTGTNPQQLAQGISIALYNTAFGLIVAIPSMVFYRHFRAKIDELLIEMEQQAILLVDVLHAPKKG